MKKITLIVALLLAAFVVKAQDDRSGFKLELDLGAVQYTNWSALSVFDDGMINQTYGLINSDRLIIGYRGNKGIYGGIGIGYEKGNAPQFKEEFLHINIIGDFKYYYRLTDRFDLVEGLEFQYIIGKNRFEFLNKDYDVNHNGWTFALNLGVNFNITDDQYVGIKASWPCLGGMDKSDLPSEVASTELVSENTRTDLYGYRIGLTWGITF